MSTPGCSRRLPQPLTVLEQSKAEDKDAIVVTKETAAKYNLKSIADLAAVADKLTLGAPPEFQTRADGVPGLQKTYNVKFKTFKKLDAGGPLTENALKNGQIDAGDIFTTDPLIDKNGWVVLEDPKNLYTAQNVLPLDQQQQGVRHGQGRAQRGVGQAHHRGPGQAQRAGVVGEAERRSGRAEVAVRRRARLAAAD